MCFSGTFLQYYNKRCAIWEDSRVRESQNIMRQCSRQILDEMQITRMVKVHLNLIAK